MMSSNSGRMSHCVVPNWNNVRQQRQEQVEGEEGNRSSHVQNHHTTTTTTTLLVPISDDYRQVKELTWENGQIAMHGLGGLLPSGPTKPTWVRTGDTLESIVHQATCHTKLDPNVAWTPAIMTSNIAGFSGGKWPQNPAGAPAASPAVRKRSRDDSDRGGGAKNFSSGSSKQEDHACASVSATFGRDSDTTMVTWTSFDSPNNNNLKNKTADEDSASHGCLENQEEDQETKGESGRSNSTRRSRAAAVHNQSERRRRDRINQKMKALQKLVPNASKTDKASMLDEVIDYLKQLQAQVQLMKTVRNMQPQLPTPPLQMVMPLGMHQQQQQQQLQISLLAAAAARMGMGMGMGMFDMNAIARAAATHSLPQLVHPNPLAAAATNGATFLPPPFMVGPHMVPTQAKPAGSGGSSSSASAVPLPDPYCALLAQSMNMEFYNKMAVLYSQQVNQATQAASSPSRSSHVQAD